MSAAEVPSLTISACTKAPCRRRRQDLTVSPAFSIYRPSGHSIADNGSATPTEDAQAAPISNKSNGDKGRPTPKGQIGRPVGQLELVLRHQKRRNKNRRQQTRSRQGNVQR